MSPILFCIGDPLLDIQVSQGAEELLAKYRLKPNDAIRATPDHASLYEEVQHRNPTLVAGGAAQNTARAAAYILPPESVVYTGCVGNDEFAEVLRAANEREGVKTVYNVHPTERTGACAVILTSQDRSLVTTLRAAGKFSIDHLTSPEVVPLVNAARFFYTTGFFLTNGVDSVLHLAKHACANSHVFALNFSAPFIPRLHFEKFEAVLPYCDIVFGNDSDALAWAETAGLAPTSTLEAIAEHIARLPLVQAGKSRVVVLTRGSRPTIMAVGSEPARTFPVEPVREAEIVDTNGAGDAFAGGFMAALILGKALEECVAVGHRMGAMNVRHVGPQYTFPKIAVLEK